MGGWLSSRSEELVQIRTLLDENARLKEEIARLTEENTLLQQDKYELNNLRALMISSEAGMLPAFFTSGILFSSSVNVGTESG